MFDHRTIFKRVIDKTIHSRAELAQYLLDLGRVHYGKRLIRLDTSLLDVLRTFGIAVPQYGNLGLYSILKKDGALMDVGHFADGEHSSINIEFIELKDYFIFVENFIEWLEKNETIESRPIVETID